MRYPCTVISGAQSHVLWRIVQSFFDSLQDFQYRRYVVNIRRFDMYLYMYVDGIYLRRNWGGTFENVAILVAIAVNEDGYREVLGAAEGMKEDKSSRVSSFRWLRSRDLDGVTLIAGDKCLGMLEAVGGVFPEAKYQRCTVHFYRNVFSVMPRSKVKLVVKMFKAIHAQESKQAAREKAKAVVEGLRSMKLKEAARKVEDGIE